MNGVNVVKVGHKQVVALIRQGGNRLVMKVVSVTRKPEEDGVRRRGEGPCTLAPGTLELVTPDPRSPRPSAHSAPFWPHAAPASRPPALREETLPAAAWRPELPW